MANYLVDGSDLTSIADAIRTKGNTSSSLTFPTEFVSAIEDIPTGGGGGITPAPVKLINFIDYDGTVLHSYTASEFAEVTALPANPTHHSNLIPQGWNRTLAQIQAHVSAFPHARIDIGQVYRTIDGKTHLHIYYDTANNLLGKEHYFLYTQTDSYGVEIDWGDGSEIETHSTTGSRVECIHNYSEPGEYEVTFNVVSGTMSFQCSSGSCVIGSTYYPDRGWNRSTVQAIEIGDNVTAIGDYAFAYCQQMETITISPDVTSIGTEAFDGMYSLRAIVMPNSITSLGQYAFWMCPSIKFISLPYSMTSWSDYIFQSCENIPSIIIPNGIASIAQYTFDQCRTMHTIVIPSSVTSIAAYAFRNATGVAEYHFQSTTPPTLANTNAFYSLQSWTKIYVPSASVNAYKTATNWSTYASQIQGE